MPNIDGIAYVRKVKMFALAALFYLCYIVKVRDHAQSK